jgi:hypothetical protein
MDFDRFDQIWIILGRNLRIWSFLDLLNVILKDRDPIFGPFRTSSGQMGTPPYYSTPGNGQLAGIVIPDIHGLFHIRSDRFGPEFHHIQYLRTSGSWDDPQNTRFYPILTYLGSYFTPFGTLFGPFCSPFVHPVFGLFTLNPNPRRTRDPRNWPDLLHFRVSIWSILGEIPEIYPFWTHLDRSGIVPGSLQRARLQFLDPCHPEVFWKGSGNDPFWGTPRKGRPFWRYPGIMHFGSF